jgi:pimeloyl-ACP methyl ester carboxylesterase
MTLLLPKMIVDASRGNYVTMSILLGVQLTTIGQISIGMHYSVQCGEEVPFIDPNAVAGAVAALPRLNTFFDSDLNTNAAMFTLCNSWGVRPPPPTENAPVVSTIPTLVLAGAYDPITPPVWGQRAAETLSTSYVYTFPNRGHGLSITGGCVSTIMRGFLANPAAPPDATCLEREQPPTFVVFPF